MNILGQKQSLHYLREGHQQKRLSPSLLFVGKEGVGKRTIAFEHIKHLVCQAPQMELDPLRLGSCDDCIPCQKIMNNNHPDFLFVDSQFQAQQLREKVESQSSVKIESIRHLTKFLSFKPMESAYRFVVIDQAHSLTEEAANALLKILEEPPRHALLILLANDARQLPSTILSRCAQLFFHPLSVSAIATWLQTHHGVAPEKAEFIADRADGSLSKALTLLEEKDLDLSFDSIDIDEFFEFLQEPSFRKEGRAKAELILHHLIEKSQRKLEEGDIEQHQSLQLLLRACRQLDRYVPPALLLENVYLSLKPARK